MWNEIVNIQDINHFMETVCCFHDSCIKEIKYVSGAYVNENLSMHPINDKRVLKVIVQRQFEDNPMIEMEFVGLKKLKLCPVDENYTCEILDATMFMKDSCIWWCDCGGVSELNLEDYDGTIICASQFRWRTIEDCMGDKEYFGEKD